ncbi:MAG: hypothetical protein KGY74_10180, partial [Candidatus Cloacimonetes bacterium]|nr:hypothetical protein [Candidatus Cloacimonadota bacterium]
MKKFIILFFVTLLFVTNIYAYPKALEDNIVDSIVTEDGKVAVAIVVPGKPPENYRAPIAYPTRTSVILSSVPAFDWSFGCSATSAAMAAGFYDNMGYPNMYDGPTNGGLMPQDNTVWPDWVDTCGATRHQCPLSATHQGLDGRTTRGHVDDYWICYGEEGPDPWEGNWPEHTYGECTADYMKTNQWVRPADTINTDGGTTFWKWTDGSPMTYTDIENEGLDDADGSYGFKLFCESRGYTVNDGYGQLIYGFDGNTKGFTYNEYKNEIDNGRPVLIHITNHTMLGYGYDDGGGTNTVYVHDTWDHNQHQMTWGGAYSGSIHYGVTTLELAPTDINVWTGDYNNYWGNADNWSLGHVPDATEDVEITDANNPCIADYSTKNCKSLTIYPGATVQIEDENIVVQEDAIIHGNLDINNTNGNLYVYDDITWESGSTCDMTESSVIYVYGTWEFKDGAEVQLDEGFVDFQGGSASFIRTKDDDSYFYRVKNNKSGSILAHSGSSTHSLHISANLYIYSGCQLKSYSDEDILIDGFINNMSGSILLDYGTLKYEGLSTTSYFESGDYINNLIINSSEKKTFQGEVEVKHDLVIDSGTLELKDNLEVDNHITINSGILDPDNCSITVAGNWLNNVGSTGFYESTSRVIFAGSDHQYIYSNETFDTLEVDCGAAVRVIDVNHTVTCNSYDWTSGGIDILSGTFTALDLENDGIYGGYWLNTDGEINLHQDGSSYIDLNGDLHIFGGTMNVYGGSLKSYWPYLQDASITMSGGVLDFKDNGIYVCVSGTHTLTEDITGGTIRTSKGFTGNRTDFNPNGGTIELYGSTDADLSMGDGSNLYNVEINKTSKENINKNTKKPEYEIVQNRDGSITRYAKSNTATAGSELDINGDVTIESGILDCNDSTMYVSGSWTNNVGDAGFVEAEGTVVFDGSLSK